MPCSFFIKQCSETWSKRRQEPVHRHAWDFVTQLAQYSVGNMTLNCRRSCESMALAPVHKAIQYNIQVHILAIVSQLLDDALNLQGNTI